MAFIASSPQGGPDAQLSSLYSKPLLAALANSQPCDTAKLGSEQMQAAIGLGQAVNGQALCNVGITKTIMIISIVARKISCPLPCCGKREFALKP